MSGRWQRSCRLGVEQLEGRRMLSIVPWGVLPAAPHGVGYVVADDYPNTFAQAAQVTLSTSGSGTQSGRIEQAGDVDVFRFTAPVTGQMTIRQSAAAGSRLDSYLYAYNAQQQLLAQNDDQGSSLNSRVVINVTAGATYYVKAAAYGRSTGAYTVQFATSAAPADDHGNTFAQATQVNLTASGSGAQSGRIEQAGDVDVFRFTAPVAGQMTIQQSAAVGSRLDAYLYIYDADGRLLAQNDDYGATQNSQVQISVVAGSTYYVKAAAYQQRTGAYVVQFTTVASTTPPAPTPAPGGFQIDVTMTGMTAAQQQIVQQAVDRWEEIIVGDLPEVVYRGRTIDDVELSISVITIDGAGGILGQAAATAFRSGSRLPYLGFIQLDTADVASMQSNGSLLGVLEHEIAHVLGFGTIWSDLGLLVGTSSSNPGFTGPQAVTEYNALFGTNVTAVPVEADGGTGTRLAHWDEAVFGNELMTGWYNSGQANPISRITVASMADLGYQVNLAAADAYAPPTSSAARSAASNASTASYNSVDFSVRARNTNRLRAVDRIMELESVGLCI